MYELVFYGYRLANKHPNDVAEYNCVDTVGIHISSSNNNNADNAFIVGCADAAVI